MVLRVSAEVEAELDEIWLYVATEGGDVGAAERLINSITDHFFLLSKHPHMGAAAISRLRFSNNLFPCCIGQRTRTKTINTQNSANHNFLLRAFVSPW